MINIQYINDASQRSSDENNAVNKPLNYLERQHLHTVRV